MQMHNPVVLALGHQNQSDVAYYSEACFPGWKFIKGTCRPVLHALLGHVHFLRLKKFTRQLTCLQSTSGSGFPTGQLSSAVLSPPHFSAMWKSPELFSFSPSSAAGSPACCRGVGKHLEYPWDWLSFQSYICIQT